MSTNLHLPTNPRKIYSMRKIQEGDHMANRAIIYRLYPTASQKLLLTKTFGCCRFVYNRLLSVQQERYKNGEKHLSRTNANNFCNRQLKPAYEVIRLASSSYAAANNLKFGKYLRILSKVYIVVCLMFLVAVFL